jgi:HSP20 family protein
MTVLRLYQKNGHPVRRENEYRFSDMMNDFFGDNYGNGHYSPRVNVYEKEDHFELNLALPGVKKNEISIDVDNDILKISSRNNNEAKHEVNYTRKEFDYSNFERSFNLPDTVNVDGIKAKMENGVLTITLPKRDDAIDKGPREIKIS